MRNPLAINREKKRTFDILFVKRLSASGTENSEKENNNKTDAKCAAPFRFRFDSNDDRENKKITGPFITR